MDVLRAEINSMWVSRGCKENLCCNGLVKTLTSFGVVLGMEPQSTVARHLAFQNIEVLFDGIITVINLLSVPEKPPGVHGVGARVQPVLIGRPESPGEVLEVCAVTPFNGWDHVAPQQQTADKMAGGVRLSKLVAMRYPCCV